MSTEAVATETEPAGIRSYGTRIRDNFRSGNLGSWPVVVALGIIVLIFAESANNFFTPGNFNNIITAMAGTCLLAYGIVFVLLIGEIDLSVSYVSGMAGVIVAELQLPNGAHLPGIVCILIAILCTTTIGALQGSVIALVGVPSFVVTLAGFLIWQGAIQQILGGVITIQDSTINNTASYFFSQLASWIIGAVVSATYVAATLGSAFSGLRHGIKIRDPLVLALKVILVPTIAMVTVAICIADRDRHGVPFVLLLVVSMLLIWTFVAKQTTFGRHVYAVGGSAEAARRAGINVPRIRILVFMIAGAMSGLGGVVLAGNIQSADLQAGGGTLLIDAIAAAVIGGTSLFGGRGEIRNGLIGALVIATIANGMNTLGWTTGVIYMVTGVILLLAVTLDTVVRRARLRSGR